MVDFLGYLSGFKKTDELIDHTASTSLSSGNEPGNAGLHNGIEPYPQS